METKPIEFLGGIWGRQTLAIIHPWPDEIEVPLPATYVVKHGSEREVWGIDETPTQRYKLSRYDGQWQYVCLNPDRGVIP